MSSKSSDSRAFALTSRLGLSPVRPPPTTLVNELQANGDEEPDNEAGQRAHRIVSMISAADEHSAPRPLPGRRGSRESGLVAPDTLAS